MEGNKAPSNDYANHYGSLVTGKDTEWLQSLKVNRG